MDDFGAGFGSFYYLKHLPFNYFKIDGDLIRGFRDNTADQLIVDAIVWIAKAMGKNTVAEFVTDQDVMDRLRCSGIDYAQGFGVGVPQPAVETFSRQRAPVVDSGVLLRTAGLSDAIPLRNRVTARHPTHGLRTASSSRCAIGYM